MAPSLLAAARGSMMEMIAARCVLLRALALLLALPIALGLDKLHLGGYVQPRIGDSEAILHAAVDRRVDVAAHHGNGEDQLTISATPAPAYVLPAHPRIRVNDEQLKTVAATAAQDAEAKAVLAQLTAYGESLLTKKLVNCTRAGVEDSLLSQARDTLDRAYSLGLLYRLTKTRKYAERLKVDLLNVAVNCTSWNPGHFLDVAEMTHAVGVGYDWTFDMLSDAEKTTIENATLTFGLHAGISAYTAAAPAWWWKSDSNWNLVCNGGLLVGSLAFADVPAMQEHAAQVIGYATTGIPFALASYHPSGGWPEGETYWGYALKYALAAIDTTQNLLSTAGDHASAWKAWPRASGFNLTGLFRVAGTGSAYYSTFNWGDSDPEANDEFNPSLLLLGRYVSPALRKVYAFAEKRQVARGGKYGGSNPSGCALENCVYRLMGWSGGETEADLKALPLFQTWQLDAMAWHNNDTDAPSTAMASFRTAWADKNASYVAVKGGNGQANHNDLDGGTFIFDAAGERWSEDLGADSYGLPGYWTKSSAFGRRYSYYRKSTHGHNTLVFGGWDGHVGESNQYAGTPAQAALGYIRLSDAVRQLAIVNLTSLYSQCSLRRSPSGPSTNLGASRVERGISLATYPSHTSEQSSPSQPDAISSQTVFVISDEWEFPTSAATLPANATWSMHTYASAIEFSNGGKTAPLSRRDNVSGSKLEMHILRPAGATFMQKLVTCVPKQDYAGVWPICDNVINGSVSRRSPSGRIYSPLRKLMVSIFPLSHSMTLTIVAAIQDSRAPELSKLTVNSLDEWEHNGVLARVKTDDSASWIPGTRVVDRVASAQLHLGSVQPRIGDAWGTNIHWLQETAEGEAAMLSKAFKLARIGFSWSEIERTKGQYNISKYDGLHAILDCDRRFWCKTADSHLLSQDRRG